MGAALQSASCFCGGYSYDLFGTLPFWMGFLAGSVLLYHGGDYGDLADLSFYGLSSFGLQLLYPELRESSSCSSFSCRPSENRYTLKTKDCDGSH